MKLVVNRPHRDRIGKRPSAPGKTKNWSTIMERAVEGMRIIRTRNEPKPSQGEVPGGRKTALGAQLGIIPGHPLRCYMTRSGISVPNFS